MVTTSLPDSRSISPYISPRQLKLILGLSEPTIWRMRRRGELPEPVRLSPNRVAWPQAAIEKWLSERAEAVGR